MAQYVGKVMWFNNAKGFGFLGREDAPDVFVHYSAIVKDGYKRLAEGEVVSFDIIQGDKGPQADDVRPVGSETQTCSEAATAAEVILPILATA